MTFSELLFTYLDQHLIRRASYQRTGRLIRTVCADWFDRQADSITKQDVAACCRLIGEDRGHPQTANRWLTVIRAAYNYHIALGTFQGENPTRGIKRLSVAGRERVVTTEELRHCLRGIRTMTPKSRAYFTLLLYVACRPSEARMMQWSDLDVEAGVWRKPLTKTGRGHVVPLPRQVLAQLAPLPRTSIYVFQGTQGKPWSEAASRKAWAAWRKRAAATIPSLATLWVYDLRRSLATYLDAQGVGLGTIQRVLGHSSLAHTSTYIRTGLATVAEALQHQADRFDTLAGVGRK